MVELGVEWIWLGLESSETDYAKLKGACVHGSTIIGLEHHTPENIGPEIDRAVAHDAVFHHPPRTAAHPRLDHRS